MKKIIKYIIAVFLIFTAACSEDLLNVDPVAQELEVSFGKTEAECLQLLAGCYDMLQAKYPWGASEFVALNVMGDEARCGGGGSDDRPEFQAMETFKIDANNVSSVNIWGKNYFGIGRCNVLINNPNIPNTDKAKQYVAQAKFLRALYYFTLVRLYGGVPIVTKILTPSEFEIPRNTVEEVYAQIDKDLTEAIEVLPLNSQLKDKNWQADKAAALALLGKARLFNKNYQGAADAFAQFFKETSPSAYGLEPDFEKIFLREGEHGLESVFEIEFGVIVWDPIGEWASNGAKGYKNGNIDVQLCGIRSLAGSTEFLNGWGFVKPTKQYYDWFKATGDTVRLKGTFVTKEELDAKGVTFSDEWQSDNIFQKKYIPRVGYGTGPSTYGNNDRLIRMGEVYLLYAEALNEIGTSDPNSGHDAAWYVNQVRARANMPALTPAQTASKAALLAAIKDERRLELGLEAMRWSDLVRWGDVGSVMTAYCADPTNGYVPGYDVNTNGLLPIPAQEIVKSKGKLTQNTGY